MKKNRFLVFCALAIILVFGAAACTRSLAPEVTSAPASGEGQAGAGGAGATSGVMEQNWQLATQTALAQQGGAAPQETALPPTAGGQEGGEVATAAPGGEEGGGQAPTQAPVVEQPTAAAPVSTATPAPTLVVVPTATPGRPATYTLMGGEFPYCIARRFNVNPVELLSQSGLSQNSQPAAGTTLTIPQTGNPFPGDRTLRDHPTTYTVRSGDNIYGIACLFGDVSPDAIAYANNLSAPYSLTAGQTLQIP